MNWLDRLGCSVGIHPARRLVSFVKLLHGADRLYAVLRDGQQVVRVPGGDYLVVEVRCASCRRAL